MSMKDSEFGRVTDAWVTALKTGYNLDELGAAERIALAYAPATLRDMFAGLFLLDRALRQAAMGGREPVLAQVRLAWWRDELTRLPDGTAHRPHPVLRHLARFWHCDPGPLVALADCWEELGTGTAFTAGAELVGRTRGEALAMLAPVDAHEACLAAARCWSLVELTTIAPGLAARDAMLEAAGTIACVRLPSALRPLAVLEGLARRALKRGEPALVGDRLSPLVAMRLGIFGR